MSLSSLASESRTSLPVLGSDTWTDPVPSAVPQQPQAHPPVAMMKRFDAEFSVFREHPGLAVVAMMPLSGFLFVGLFLGELIGALLGIYFVGINLIFLRKKTRYSQTQPPVRGSYLDLIPETACRRLSP